MSFFAPRIVFGRQHPLAHSERLLRGCGHQVKPAGAANSGKTNMHLQGTALILQIPTYSSGMKDPTYVETEGSFPRFPILSQINALYYISPKY
jgi:hypothetical protein